jgi:hypothetical protein
MHTINFLFFLLLLSPVFGAVENTSHTGDIKTTLINNSQSTQKTMNLIMKEVGWNSTFDSKAISTIVSGAVVTASIASNGLRWQTVFFGGCHFLYSLYSARVIKKDVEAAQLAFLNCTIDEATFRSSIHKYLQDCDEYVMIDIFLSLLRFAFIWLRHIMSLRSSPELSLS